MRQNIQLFINNQEVEFSAPPDIFYTYKQTDLTNPTVVKNSFSKSITIEGTPGNNDLFGHIWNVERTQSDISFNASKKAPFELYINGTIYESGYVRMYDAKVTNKGIHYDITLYGGLGDFFYNLSYGADGEERTLASLHYMTGDTSVNAENEFDFDVNKETIYDAWITTGPDSTGNTKWRYINFCPSYNGIPDKDFDADKVLMNFVDSPVPAAVEKKEEKEKDNRWYMTTDGWSIGEMSEDLTEWEMRDIRSYLQRPCIRTKEIINACCNPENNGGFTVDLDSDFFNSNNPYWEDSWMTLPMVSDLEYGDTETVYSDADLICGDSVGTLPEQFASLVFQSGSFSQDIMGKVSVTGKILAKVLVPTGWTNLYTSYVRLSNNGSKIKTGMFGALRCQLVAYNGDNVVGVSNTIRLTTRIYVDKTGDYIVWDEKNNNGRGMYRVTNGDTNYTSSYGNFKLQSGDTYYWKPDSGGETLTFNIGSINTNVTSLKMRFLWEASDDLLKDYTYGALFKNTLHYGTGSDSNFGMLSTSACSMTVTDKNFKAVVGSAAKTGTHITKNVLLGNTSTPCDYLISFCKMYGLYFIKDLDANKVQILTRNNFYNNPNYHDLSDLLDRGKEMKINPLTFTAKWYDFQLDMDDTEFAQKYENAYGTKYGMQTVNTGYEFGNDRSEMLEKIVYKGGVETMEKSKYYTTLSQDNYFKPYMLYNFKYKLWYEDKEMDVDMKDIVSSRSNSLFGINEQLRFYDVFPKLQFHDKSNKGTDGSNVLVFFNGFKNVVNGITRPLYYYLTDDLPYMQILNEGSCWLYTNSEYDKDGNRIAYRLTEFPVFERYVTQNNSGFIQKSMDFGSPRELYVPTYTHLENATVYDYFWKNYINDLYSIDSRVLDCYVKLNGKPNPEWLRNFYWFDNCVWRLNEIVDWNVGGEDSVHMQFIKVQDTNNYTSVQPTTGNRITLVLSKYMVDASGETITATVTAPAGFNWHVEYPSGVSVSPLSGTGNGTFTITIPANTGDTQKTYNISVVGYQAQARATVGQHYDGEGAFTISPRDLVVPYSGGTYELDVTWDNKGTNSLSTTIGRANVISYTADVTTYALQNKITVTVPAYMGDTILNDYATFSVSGDSSLTYTLGICQLPEVMEYPATGMTTGMPFTYLHNCTFVSKPFWVLNGSLSGGNVNVTIQANPNDTRDGIVEVSGDGTSATMTFVQLSSGGNGLLDPEVLNYPASGAVLTFDIKTDGAWQIVGKPDWITLSSTAGTGTTTISATGAANTTATERTNSIAVYFAELHNTYPVITNQEAGNGSGVNPSYLVFDQTGGTEQLTININCNWEIVGKPFWINVSAMSGSGSTTINATATINGDSPREGTIVFYDYCNNMTYTVSVYQDGIVYSLTVSPSAQTVPVSGGVYNVIVHYNNRGNDTITIDTNSNTAITYTPTSVTWDNNDCLLEVTIAPNTVQSSITHTILYSAVNRTISVEEIFTQEYGEYAILDTNNHSFSDDSGSTGNGITSNVSWTATTDSEWISFSPTSGNSGYTSIAISVESNMTSSNRTGHIFIRSINTNELLATITISQYGVSEYLIVTPTTYNFGSTGGTVEIIINSNTSWTITEI